MYSHSAMAFDMYLTGSRVQDVGLAKFLARTTDESHVGGQQEEVMYQKG
jgi:hypothetical protein